MSYADRPYRIYGHPCTRRRYIIEWIGVVCVSIGAAIGSVTLCEHAGKPWWMQIAIAVSVGLVTLYYRIRALNVNGYTHEQPDDATDRIPWVSVG